MKNKKGAGTIIAWVLLLGFAIGLATTVFLWTTQQTEEMGKSAVKFVEGGMQCDNTMINVIKNTDCSLTVKNSLYLNIEKVVLRNLEQVISKDCDGGSPLEVKKEITCTESIGWCGNVTVMPIIKVNDDLVGCKNKAVLVEVDCGCTP